MTKEKEYPDCPYCGIDDYDIVDPDENGDVEAICFVGCRRVFIIKADGTIEKTDEVISSMVVHK